MRNGKLLAEDTPQKLLAMYNCCDGLEQVFLKLSVSQDRNTNEVLSKQETILPRLSDVSKPLEEQKSSDGITDLKNIVNINCRHSIRI